MDNLTHGLAGALVAECWLQFAPQRWRPSRRGLAYFASIAANNLPDLDFVATGLTEGKLGYLLHHRGHTHTLPGALILGAIETGLIALWLRSRTATWIAEVQALLPLISIGVLLHLVLDLGNNYGVHPFWPLDNHWYYGDLTFIIEPWWWSAAGACLFGLAQSRTGRLVTLGIWALGVVVPWLLPLPKEAGIYGLLVGCAAMLGARLLSSPARQALFGLLSVVGLYGVQAALQSRVASRVQAALSGELAVLDLVRTPLPSAPWCWDLVLVGVAPTLTGSEYVLRLGRVSVFPELFAPARCPKVRPNPTAVLHAVTETPAALATGVLWDAEYRSPLSALRATFSRCDAAAFLRYARAPFFNHEARILGDLRFDRTPDVEFAEFELPGVPKDCPRWVPAWLPPRADLLKHLSAE